MNMTSAKDFLIVGFSDLPQLQIPLFIAFLVIYLLTLVGNTLILATVYCSSHLQTPMYFFLTQLSFLDVSYTSVIFPQTLAFFFLEGTRVSLSQCLLQMYLFLGLASVEFLLLTVMAYDRYVAICIPLRYMIIIDKAACIQLATGCWVFGFLNLIPHTILVSRLSFCESHTINHFFCDMTALMKISCSNTRRIETLTYIIGVIVAVTSFIFIIVTYSNIASCILKIKSTLGRHKAFSTCASHLTAVILFYGSFCSMYMRPTSTYSMEENKIMSLLYIAVTPLCNPVIYCLKNTEFKNALRKITKMS